MLYLLTRVSALLVAVTLRAGTNELFKIVPDEEDWSPELLEETVETPDLWFPVGERFVYNVYWGIVHVAQSRVETDWVKWPDGRPVIRIRYRTRSNRVLSKLYPVDDTHDSFIDPVTFLPLRFVKNLREGRHRKHDITDFNHTAGVARWRRLAGRNQEYELPIDADLRDIPSLSYWLRRDGIPTGTNLAMKVMADDKAYDLELVSSARVKSLSVSDFGKIPTVQVVPEAKFEGLFVRKGRAVFHVSEGTPCLVVRIDASIPVGSIKIILSKIEGPEADEWPKRWKNKSD